MGSCGSQPTDNRDFPQKRKPSRLTANDRTTAAATDESTESGARAQSTIQEGQNSTGPPVASAALAPRRPASPLFTLLPDRKSDFESQRGQESDLGITIDPVVPGSSECGLPPAHHSASRTPTLSLSGASHQRTQDTSLVAQMGGSAADALSFVSDATSGMEWSGQFTSIPLVALECEGGQRVR